MISENPLHLFWWERLTAAGWSPVYLPKTRRFKIRFLQSRSMVVVVDGACSSIEQLRRQVGDFNDLAAKHDVLVVGNRPLVLAQGVFMQANGTDGFGLLKESDRGWSEDWEECFLAICTNCNKYLPISDHGSYACRHCGIRDGKDHIRREFSLLHPTALTRD